MFLIQECMKIMMNQLFQQDHKQRNQVQRKLLLRQLKHLINHPLNNQEEHL